jgi:ribosomal protein L11 methyltransferase
VWILTPRTVRTGRLLIVPAEIEAPPGALRLSDGPAFGTGLHATTALCLDVLAETLAADFPAAVLDVGIGSGVLALAALILGVPHATGLDTDPEALRVAADNAHANGLAGRLELVGGGPEAVDGTWPLVFANVVAAPLIEMAPTLVRRLRSGGRLVLSGIPESMASEVERVYRRLGMRSFRSDSREGWTALVLHPSW